MLQHTLGTRLVKMENGMPAQVPPSGVLDTAALGLAAGAMTGMGPTSKLQVETPRYAAQQDSFGLQRAQRAAAKQVLQTLLTKLGMVLVPVLCGIVFA